MIEKTNEFRLRTPQANALWYLAWLAIVVLYLLYLKIPISRAYIDFGDGNYQYISWRINQGVNLYTDILSPQPPFHLWLGACIERITTALDLAPLIGFRWAIHFIRVLISLCVFSTSLLLFRQGLAAWLAGVVFLFLPEGYRWSGGYQSEHLELLCLTLGLLCWAHGKTWTRGLTGICAVCAIWTNMSALPFSILLVALACAGRHRPWLPLLSMAGALVLLLGISLGLAGDAYFENVWSNQVASIPTNPTAWISSLSEQGTTLITFEGPFILLALLGLYRFQAMAGETRDRSAQPSEIFLMTLYGIASIGSGIYVIKGGTVDYIFCLAEPVIALFSAWTLVQWFRAEKTEEPACGHLVSVSATRLCQAGLIVGIGVVLLWQPWRLMGGIRTQSAPEMDLPDVSQGRIVEFSDREVRTLERVIGELSKPGDTIWAPPFLAALTQREIALDLSETYLWWVRWYQSVVMNKEDAGVNRMLEGMTGLLSSRKIPVLVINDRTGQWGQLLVPGRELQNKPLREIDPRLERLQKAMEDNYQPLLAHPGSETKLYFQGWNERLEVWVPKGGPAYLPPWVKEGFGG